MTTDKGLVPRVRPVSVMQAEVAGKRVELQVHREGGRLSVGLSPGGSPKPYYSTDTDVPAVAGGAWGLPIHGLAPAGQGDLHWVGWVGYAPGPIEPAGGGTGPKYIYGLAAANVRRVDLEGRSGTVVRVPAFAGPSTLGTSVRVWVAVLWLD